MTYVPVVGSPFPPFIESDIDCLALITELSSVSAVHSDELRLQSCYLAHFLKVCERKPIRFGSVVGICHGTDNLHLLILKIPVLQFIHSLI